MKRFAGLILCVVICSMVGLLPAQEAKQVIPHHQDKPPGPALSPQEAIKKMTVPEGFHGRAGRQRAGHRQPGRHDVRRARPHLDHREPRVSAQGAGPGPRPRQGPRRHRRRRQGRQVHRLRRGAEHSLRHRRRARRRVGRQRARHPLPAGHRRRRQGRQAARSSSPASAATTRTSCPTRSPGGPTAGSTASTASSTTATSSTAARSTSSPAPCSAFIPRTREFELFCEGTSNPWGVAWDSEGSAFVSACVIDHLWHLAETRLLPPAGRAVSAVHLEDRARSSSTSTRRRPTAASTSSTATPIPPQYRERLYMGNIHGSCINVDALERDGSDLLRPRREPDFLTANDAWFMPVVQKTGPDGCLYVLDWYDRYHCYQDANRDPGGHRPPQGPALSRALQGHAAGRELRPGEGDRRRS